MSCSELYLIMGLSSDEMWNMCGVTTWEHPSRVMAMGIQILKQRSNTDYLNGTMRLESLFVVRFR